MDPSHSKTPFRRCQVPLPGEPTSLEEHVSEPFYLPRMLHQDSSYWKPRESYRRGCARGWLDPDLFLRRPLRIRHRRSGDMSHPVPRILACNQGYAHQVHLLSVFKHFRPHPLVPSPRGPLCGCILRDPPRRGFPRPTNGHPSLEFTHIRRDSRNLRLGRDASNHFRVAIATEQPSISEIGLDVEEQRRCFLNDGIGGRMFLCSRVSRD